MTCTRELLLTRALSDPELLEHLESCAWCAAQHEALVDVVPRFHAGLEATTAFSLPPPSKRFSMPALPALLVAAATLGVIGLALAPERPPIQDTHQASVGIDVERAREISAIPRNALSVDEWSKILDELLPEGNRALTQREPTVQGLEVLVQTGRAVDFADRSNEFRVEREGVFTNRFFFGAARILAMRPELRDAIKDPEALTLLELIEPSITRSAAAASPGRSRAQQVSTIPWDAITDKEWKAIALELEPAAAEAVRKKSETADTLLLLLQTGRAAENANHPAPPFYGERNQRPVNLYYYEASRLVKRRPDLLETIASPDHQDIVQHLMRVHP